MAQYIARFRLAPPTAPEDRHLEADLLDHLPPDAKPFWWLDGMDSPERKTVRSSDALLRFIEEEEAASPMARPAPSQPIADGPPPAKLSNEPILRVQPAEMPESPPMPQRPPQPLPAPSMPSARSGAEESYEDDHFARLMSQCEHLLKGIQVDNRELDKAAQPPSAVSLLDSVEAADSTESSLDVSQLLGRRLLSGSVMSDLQASSSTVSVEEEDSDEELSVEEVEQRLRALRASSNSSVSPIKSPSLSSPLMRGHPPLPTTNPVHRSEAGSLYLSSNDSLDGGRVDESAESSVFAFGSPSSIQEQQTSRRQQQGHVEEKSKEHVVVDYNLVEPYLAEDDILRDLWLRLCGVNLNLAQLQQVRADGLKR